MKILYKIGFASFVGFSLIALIGCAVLRPIGQINVQELTYLETDKDQLNLETEPPIQVTAYVTGWVKAPADILIAQDTPNLPNILSDAQWVPSIAYAVRHPRLGVVILDTGLRAEECDYGTRPIYWVPCRNTHGSDLVSQLKRTGIQPQDIRQIIPSHFHGDHISGLESLLAFSDAPVLMSSASLEELKSPARFAAGIPSDMLESDMRVELLDAHWTSDPILGESFDVFGNGSLKIFRTRGHSDGHLSALVTTASRTTLLTFDAAHLQANFDLGVPSGSVASEHNAVESLEFIKHLSSELPGLHIVFGHEPSQWMCIDESIDLDVMAKSCNPSLPPL